MARSSVRYQPREESSEDKSLVGRIHELVRERPRFGYRRMTKLLRREGWRVNFKRVYRLWRHEGLKVPKKQRKRRYLGSSANGCIRQRAQHKDHVWALDFVHDRTVHGYPLKMLGIIDEYTRECLALEVSRSITADRVLDVLVNLFLTRGVPSHIRSDNGPEFIAQAIRDHLEATGVGTLYINPGSPWENGYAESFFSRLRDELLAGEQFESFEDARWFVKNWHEDYNECRPHSSLGYLTPSEFASQLAASATASATPQPPLQQPTAETVTQTSLS